MSYICITVFKYCNNDELQYRGIEYDENYNNDHICRIYTIIINFIYAVTLTSCDNIVFSETKDINTQFRGLSCAIFDNLILSATTHASSFECKWQKEWLNLWSDEARTQHKIWLLKHECMV